MAYNPHATTSEDRFPSGIVFFGASSTKPMLDSSSSFIIDEDNNSLALADGYYLGSQSYRQLLNLASDGTATFASGVIVQGNLTVNGDVVTVNTEQILVEDNVITLSSGAFEDPSQNAGIEIYRGSGNHDVMSFTWNETSDKWTFTDTSGTYDLVGADLSQELRNKTLDGNYNDFANIPNDGLSNSSITITAGTGLKTGGTVSLGGTGVLDIDLNDLPTGAIANGDSIAFIDANDGNATKKESIADIAALFAGNGLTATNSVINVAGQSGISATADYLYVDKTVITGQPINSMSIQNDFMLFYDANQDELAKITVQNLAENIAYSISGESITSFTLGDSFGNVATIIDGSAALFNEVASGIETRVAVNGTVSIGINLVSNSGLSFQGGELRVDESLINNRAELSSAPDATNDYLLIYDASATALRKINRNNFVSGLGTMASFTLAGDTGTNQTITNGNTVTIAGGTGLSSVGSNTDTVTINLDNTSVSAGTYGDANTIASFTVDAQGRLTDASGVDVNITASQVSDFTSASETAIFTSANFVDGTALDFTVTNGQSVSAAVKYDDSTIGVTSDQLYVKDGGITFAKLNGGAYLTSAETFSDSNTQLMTAAAIADKIESYNYLVAGDLTAGDLIDISSTTINVDLTEAALATIANGDYLIFLDGGATGAESKGTVAGLATLLGGDGLGVSGSTLSVNVDDSTIETNSDTLRVKSLGIDTAQLADGAVTEAKRDRTVVAMTSTGTIATTTDIALASNSITLTLPAGVDGKIVRVKNIGSGTVTVSSSSLIDGAGSKILYYQNESMTFVYYGSGSTWYVI